MNVKELIEMLKGVDPEATVTVAANGYYGADAKVTGTWNARLVVQLKDTEKNLDETVFRKVPLVIYDKDGTRQVVGDSELEVVDGEVRVRSSEITDPDILKLFEPGTHGFAIKEN